MTVSVPGCFYGTGMVGLPDAPSFLALAKGADGTDGSRPSASTSDLIAGRALDANGRYVNHVLDDPDLMAPFQPEPVGRLGGVFVFGNHHQLAGLLDVVSDLLGAAEARPLPQELHFHKNQYRVRSDFNHGVPPFSAEPSSTQENSAARRSCECGSRTGASAGSVACAAFVSIKGRGAWATRSKG